MPGCSAINCSNSSIKGFLMKRFPKDPERRKQWLIETKRGYWTPTDNSYLCEAHFAPEMWEKTREDGSRKLRANSIPTIFSFDKPKRAKKPPRQRKSLSPKKVKPSLSSEATEPVEINVPESTALTQPATSSTAIQGSRSPSSHSTSSEDIALNVSPIQSPIPTKGVQNADDLLGKLIKYEKLVFKERARARKYKKNT